MTYYALTVKQPWASLILSGVKDVENRTWPVPSTLRQSRLWRCKAGDDLMVPSSPQLIPTGHYIKDPSGVGGRWCQAGYAAPEGPFPFPLAIHAGKSVDYAAMDIVEVDGAGGDYLAVQGVPVGGGPVGALLGWVTMTGCHHANETCRGGCSPWAEAGDVWHWTLADPRPLPEPVPMRGRQRLWRLPEGITP